MVRYGMPNPERMRTKVEEHEFFFVFSKDGISTKIIYQGKSEKKEKWDKI